MKKKEKMLALVGGAVVLGAFTYFAVRRSQKTSTPVPSVPSYPIYTGGYAPPYTPQWLTGESGCRNCGSNVGIMMTPAERYYW
jgi:hypothetical protein